EQTWQLREFEIDGASHVPVPVTIKQTPSRVFADESRQERFLLAQYIRDNLDDVIAETNVVPEFEPLTGVPFLGGETTHDGSRGHWTAGDLLVDSAREKEARHKFSLNTCNGCHGAETG